MTDGDEVPTYPTTADAPTPTKVCPKCSAQSETSGAFCPHCGAGFEKRKMSKRAKLAAVAAVVVVLLIGGAIAGLLAKHSHDQHQARVAATKRSAAAASSQASVARAHAIALKASKAAAASASASAAAEEDDLERTRREGIISDMEASITKDAKKDVEAGVLDGPIKSTDCTPVGGGSTDILTDTTGEFTCIAINKVEGTTESGYTFTAVVNWTQASYSWHLGD